MSRPLYSTEFIRGTIAAGAHLDYTVPNGFVAVVRDIMMINQGVVGTGLFGCWAQDDAGAWIYALFTPVACVGNPYTWEGRAVMNAGETLSIHSLDAGWKVRASGYLLTTP